MASGKLSPRQKMINMMYLVLTALLAMNVSSEILNAFKTINASISKTNSVLDGKNEATYSALQDALQDPQQKQKAEIWLPKALKCKELSTDMVNYIEKMKQDLKKESDLKIEKGEESFKEDDLDASTRYMIEKKKGTDLYKKFKQYKQDILNVFRNSTEFDAELKERIMKDMESMERSLPIYLEVPKAKPGKTSYSNDGPGWSQATFYMTPTLASVTILSKMQNDIKNSEAQMSDYCLSQLGKVKLIYDKFAAIAAANTTYCMPGDEIEISAGVGAFNDQAKPIINIAGQNVALNADGMAVWKSTASGAAGPKEVPVRIQYTTPDGKVESKTMSIKYSIGTPSGAAVMLDKMNVFYIGLDNPVTISSGTGDDKTNVSASGGGIQLSKTAPGKYNVRVTTVGQSAITINADKKTTTYNFRVKRVPDPIATIGGKITSGKVKKGELAVQQGIVAVLQNFDFEAKFTVQSFDYIFIPKGEDLSSGTATGPAFPGRLVDQIKNCKPKDVFQFENIKVVGPDGQPRKIPGLGVTII